MREKENSRLFQHSHTRTQTRVHINSCACIEAKTKQQQKNQLNKRNDDEKKSLSGTGVYINKQSKTGSPSNWWITWIGQNKRRRRKILNSTELWAWCIWFCWFFCSFFFFHLFSKFGFESSRNSSVCRSYQIATDIPVFCVCCRAVCISFSK